MSVRRLVLLRSSQSILSRRYLIGAVLAWVLVVYLAAGPSVPTFSPAFGSGGSAPASPAASPAPVAAVRALLASGSIPSSNPSVPVQAFATPLGGFPPLTFPPPAPPPNVPEMHCPYPIPQAQSSPISPGVILSFESPLMELSGPYAAWDIPTLGAIEPVIPLVTPVLSISQPVMNEVTPNESVVATDIATLEARAGLDGPQNAKYAQEFEPYWLKLVYSLTPYEAALASTTAAQCVALFGNALAQRTASLDLNLPPLPTLPSGIPPGSADATAVAGAVLSATRSPFVTFALPWSQGMPPGLPAEVRDLAARHLPVEIQLLDAPPKGQSLGTTGFADFVATTVHSLPQATAFEVDGPSLDPSGSAAEWDLVHGLAAADFARQGGQLIGMGVPTSALGQAAPAFWSMFSARAAGFQANLVDFVGAVIPAGDPSAAAAAARGLERDWSALGGVPRSVPFFASIPEERTSSADDVLRQMATYESALSVVHLGLLEVLPAER
jgi:hypothetical protein